MGQEGCGVVPSLLFLGAGWPSATSLAAGSTLQPSLGPKLDVDLHPCTSSLLPDGEATLVVGFVVSSEVFSVFQLGKSVSCFLHYSAEKPAFTLFIFIFFFPSAAQRHWFPHYFPTASPCCPCITSRSSPLDLASLSVQTSSLKPVSVIFDSTAFKGGHGALEKNLKHVRRAKKFSPYIPKWDLTVNWHHIAKFVHV